MHTMRLRSKTECAHIRVHVCVRVHVSTETNSPNILKLEQRLNIFHRFEASQIKLCAA